jgi:NAD(P)-dependent dehydrogenase (short-subunit alcohol dehydrogenase family)
MNDLNSKGFDVQFSDKVAVVTGATSGIGRATVEKFESEGARVAAIGRNDDALAAVRSERVATYKTDLSSEAQVQTTASKILDDLGSIDVLVNAAGIIATGSVEDTTLADYDAMMGINVRSILQLTQLCLPSIIERKGNIVNVSSVTGLRAFPNVLAYCVSKAALDQLTSCAALELAPKGVRVNAVNPGVVRTNLHRRSGMDDATYDAFAERGKATHPIGRIGEPDEIAELIMYLASDKAGWITGVTYSIDGGRADTCAR